MQIFIRFFIFIVFVTNVKTSIAQSWQWANSIGNSEGYVIINGMAKLSKDEIVAVGSFQAPNITIGNDVLEATIGSNIVCILNKKGEYRKAIKFDENSEFLPVSVVADKEDNIYVAGTFSSLLFFAGNDTLVNQGNTDAYVVKLDRELNVIWTKTFATALQDEVNKINIDNEGNVLIASTISNTSGPDVSYKTSITKLAPDNTILWTKEGVSEFGSYTKSILIDNDNNCYWVGESSDLILEDGYSIQDTTTWDFGFIIKFSSIGERLDIKRLPSISSAYLKDQQFYVVQYIYDTIDYNMIGMRTLKYDMSFNSKWQKDILNIRPEYSGWFANYEMNISVDDQGGIYLLGGMSGDSLIFANDTLSEISQESSLLFNSNTGIYLFKYNKDGEEVWANKTGGELTNSGVALLVYGEDEVIIAGVFQDDTLQFGDLNLYNDNKIDTLIFIHGHLILSKPVYSYFASFGKIKTGIHQFKTFQAKLYPNPSKDEILIESPEFLDRPVQLKIYSTDGKLVQFNQQKPIGNQLQLNISGLQDGMYFINIQQEDQFTTLRFLKN